MLHIGGLRSRDNGQSLKAVFQAVVSIGPSSRVSIFLKDVHHPNYHHPLSRSKQIESRLCVVIGKRCIFAKKTQRERESTKGIEDTLAGRSARFFFQLALGADWIHFLVSQSPWRAEFPGEQKIDGVHRSTLREQDACFCLPVYRPEDASKNSFDAKQRPDFDQRDALASGRSCIRAKALVQYVRKPVLCVVCAQQASI